jgi:methionyl-tRNA formyltransferase
MKFVYFADRQISVNILKYLLNKGHFPEMLVVSSAKSQSHRNELIDISGLTSDLVLDSECLKLPESYHKLSNLNADYFIGIHFPFIIPERILSIPRIGFINLHPAFLPYNKGWHTPSWAILDGSPYGATLHFMSRELDGGDIIRQKLLHILPEDTAHSLYQRVLLLEEELFYESLDDLLSLDPQRIRQIEPGTSHVRKDLASKQELDLNLKQEIGETLNTLRALTTNDLNESAYFTWNGEKIHVRVSLHKPNDLKI